ncbi:HAD-IIA family hydrolase [Archangium lipolyticum]|uniref:HAD-IIA family hydrolase n=1 Tax=Archangium lipolyticum TaxID=2970465 RepID=UPI002149E8F6|nr:HAD-IIA family hydrolase [Archangium lipolyticum]
MPLRTSPLDAPGYTRVDSESVGELLLRYDTVILDLDGVVLRYSQPIPGVDRTLRHLRKQGRRVRVSSNSMRRTPRHISQTLTALDIPLAEEDILTSGRVTLDFLSRLPVESPGVLAFGCNGLEGDFERIGLKCFDPGKPVEVERIGMVVVGAIEETAFRLELYEAALNAAVRGVPVIATSLDLTVPARQGLKMGSGLLAQFLIMALKQDTRNVHVTGKPGAIYFDFLREHFLGREPGRCIFVGDTLLTDITGARDAGFDTLFVLSGNDDLAYMRHLGIRPDFISASIAEGESYAKG